jgi:hypothetical protein
MINRVVEATVQCPYCWEQFTLLVDGSVDLQEYVEDCEVCCRPIDFTIAVDGDEVNVQARLQDE